MSSVIAGETGNVAEARDTSATLPLSAAGADSRVPPTNLERTWRVGVAIGRAWLDGLLSVETVDPEGLATSRA